MPTLVGGAIPIFTATKVDRGSTAKNDLVSGS